MFQEVALLAPEVLPDAPNAKADSYMVRIGGQKVPTHTLLLVASDAILVILGLLAAIYLRFRVLDHESALYYLDDPRTPARFLIVILVCEIALYFNDLYDLRLVRRRTDIFVHLLQAFGVACLALAVIYYIDPDVSFGRGIAVLSAPIILVLTLAWRLVLDATQMANVSPARVLIVGTGPNGIAVAREVLGRPELNSKVVGFLDEKGENIGKSLVNPGIIGGVSEVEEIVGRERIDRVVLALTERRGKMPVRELLHLKFSGVVVEDAHSFYERINGRIPLEYLSPSWLIFSDGFRKSDFLRLTKRVIDIAASLAILTLAAPVMTLVALAIWLESGRPILFRQERTGLGGHAFEIQKFRSMRQDAEPNGPCWATEDDPRTTHVGRFIRKWRLDELPQLFNVLRGEMSLVGPRPERPHFCAMLEEQIPLFAHRHSVRPGLTGWAQIKYQYGGSVEEAKTKLEYDLFYIKHMSVMLDLAILFETARVVLYGRNSR